MAETFEAAMRRRGLWPSQARRRKARKAQKIRKAEATVPRKRIAKGPEDKKTLSAILELAREASIPENALEGFAQFYRAWGARSVLTLAEAIVETGIMKSAGDQEARAALARRLESMCRDHAQEQGVTRQSAMSAVLKSEGGRWVYEAYVDARPGETWSQLTERRKRAEEAQGVDLLIAHVAKEVGSVPEVLKRFPQLARRRQELFRAA